MALKSNLVCSVKSFSNTTLHPFKKCLRGQSFPCGLGTGWQEILPLQTAAITTAIRNSKMKDSK